jgi:hypothetical protein
VLERVEDVHRAVLGPVLVAGHDATRHATVIRPLAGVVEQVAVPVQALDHLGADGRLLAQPNRAEQDEDVGRRHFLEDRRPLVALPSVLGHVRVHAGRDLMVDRADHLAADADAAHDSRIGNRPVLGAPRSRERQPRTSVTLPGDHPLRRKVDIRGSSIEWLRLA